MAWNALTGQFRRRDEDTKRESDLFGGRPSGGSAGVGGGAAPTANPLGGFGGTGDSAGAPTSASHVNYGTLYGANEEKAKQMANRVYRGAEKKADDAKKTAADAQQTFADKAAANAGSWRPIGGAHGTRIENKTGGGSTDTGQGWNNYTWSGGTAQRREGSDGGVTGTRGLQQPGASSSSAGATRYASLYGPQVSLDSSWNPTQAESARDYHHSVSELEAKSGAGQDYTGPKSLKESMGEEAYGKASEDLKKAQDAVSGLQDSGGIAEALGYQGTEGDGLAAMDAGLTQTAGQSSFKDLARRYSGLGKTLQDANANAMADAGRSDVASEAAASDWDALLKEYETNKPKDPNAPIIIGAAGSTLGRTSGSEEGIARTPGGPGSNAGAATGADNSDPKYGGTTKGAGGQSNGLWPNGIYHDSESSWTDPYGSDEEKQWESFWSTVPEATKEWLTTLTPEERQKWADEQWAKLKGGE